jgi:hypothetical protein
MGDWDGRAAETGSRIDRIRNSVRGNVFGLRVSRTHVEVSCEREGWVEWIGPAVLLLFFPILAPTFAHLRPRSSHRDVSIPLAELVSLEVSQGPKPICALLGSVAALAVPGQLILLIWMFGGRLSEQIANLGALGGLMAPWIFVILLWMDRRGGHKGTSGGNSFTFVSEARAGACRDPRPDLAAEGRAA